MSRYRRTIAAALTIAMLPIIPSSAFAQSSAAAARVIESAKYLSLSEESFNCDIATARRWVRKAESTLGGAGPGGAAQEATAAVLRARVSVMADHIEKRQKALKDAADEVSGHLDSHMITSALRSLDRINKETPTCDVRFKDWRREAEDQYAATMQLVREGDALLGHAPEEARNLYERARRINREEPAIENKIQQAKEAARASGGGKALHAVGWILVIGGLLAAGKAMEIKKRKDAQGGTAVGAYSPN